MSAALSTVTFYFGVDALEDISTDTLTFSLIKTAVADGTAGTFVVPGADPTLDAWLALKTPPPQGLTRFWWSLLIGAGQPLAPSEGVSTVYGQLVDTTNKPVFAWPISIPN